MDDFGKMKELHFFKPFIIISSLVDDARKPVEKSK